MMRFTHWLRFRRLGALTVATTVSAMTLAVAPGTALAAPRSATLTLAPVAQLQPDGSALAKLVYSCQPGLNGTDGFDFVELTQPASSGSGHGTGFQSATCDGKKHVVTIDVSPDVFSPFSQGPASARAQVFSSDGSGEAFVTAKVQIR